MLMIRLTRVGKKKHPTYRVVVQQREKAPSANVLEILGHYNPHTNPATIAVQGERLQYWMKNGAQLSDTLHNLLVGHKLLDAEKRKITRTKRSAEAEPVVPVSASAENTTAESTVHPSLASNGVPADQPASESAASEQPAEEKTEASS